MIAENQVDKFLTVGGLRVMGDVTSNNISQLTKKVQENFDKTQNLTAEQKDFWSKLADDNLITPVEKKQLKQELAVITQTHTSIINLASEKGEQDNPLIMMYDAKYGDLLDYINKIKLFDEMTKSTNVDKTEFTKKFTEYYDSEIIAQSIFTGKTSATIRVLSSLFETGTMNEVATYRGVFYKWNGKQWVLVNGNEYLGMFDHLPEANINDYFLCGIDFEEKLTLKTNGKSLLTDGKILQVNHKFEKGFIYVSTDKGWKKIENKSDYRYFLITNDLISIGEMSPGLENAISTGQPRYLGLFYELPTEYKKNDWFTYAGVSTETYTQGRVYKWNGEEWELVTSESKNYQMLMTSLTDIINANPSGEGYFTTIFAQALISSQAFIQNLQSQIITLQNGGRIQSENYEQGKLGFLLDSNGVFECSAGTFRGSIESGPLVLNTTSPGEISKTYETGEKIIDVYNNLFSLGVPVSYIKANVTYKGLYDTLLKISKTETSTTSPSGYKRWARVIDSWVNVPGVGPVPNYKNITYVYTVITTKTTYRIETQQWNEEAIMNTTNYVQESSYEGKEGEEASSPIPKTEIIDNGLEDKLEITLNSTSATMRLKYIPTGISEDYEIGTIYHENGVLKIKI